MRNTTGIVSALLLIASPLSAQGQAEGAGAEAWPSAVEVESSSSESKDPPAETVADEPPRGDQWPAAVSVEYVDQQKTEDESTSAYSKKVQGKMWVEAFVGPSSYDPDRFGAGNPFFDLVGFEIPKVKGPEFGAALGGALANQVVFLGAAYRQANYEIGEGRGSYKLMKVGADAQFVFTFVPYVHPLIRIDVGYARLFGGNLSANDAKNNGLYFTLGFGVRVPIVRWVSFVATFDWSRVTIYPKGGAGFSLEGSQLGGTFGLTLHFIGVT